MTNLHDIRTQDIYFWPEYGHLYEQDGTRFCQFRHRCEAGEIYYGYLERDITWDGPTEVRDIVTPYGYGGPLLFPREEGTMGELAEAFAREFGALCRERGIVSEFVRFHPVLRNHEALEALYKPELYSYNVVIDLAPPIETLWKDFAHKVRKNVNKARTFGLRTVCDRSAARLDDFLSIYYATMDRRQAAASYYFPREYFEALVNTMPNNVCFFFVENEGEVVSTELVLLGGDGLMHSFLGGTLEEAFPMRPNDLLKFAAIEWGKENGYQAYVLGGGASPQDGIYQYKLSFAKEGTIPFYLGKKVWDAQMYDLLVEQARRGQKEEETTGFFPLYRANRV